jgi:hypothetical protein
MVHLKRSTILLPAAATNPTLPATPETVSDNERLWTSVAYWRGSSMD